MAEPQRTPSEPVDTGRRPRAVDDDEVLRRTAEDMSTAPGTTGAEPSVASQRPRRSRWDDDEPLPPMTEQIAEQLGGVRGLVESGIPVGVFVVCNVFLADLLGLVAGVELAEGTALRWSIGAAVGVALLIAALRALRKEPIRHALNGLLGIAIGAYLAWNSGDEGDFYLPGIIQGAVYGVALMGSVAIRHPLVGWLWSMVAGGGKAEWRQDARLVRVFGWVTMLWGAVFLLKNLLRGWLYLADQDTVLGLVTLVGGYPVTALLIAVSLLVVRRTHPGMTLSPRRDESAG